MEAKTSLHTQTLFSGANFVTYSNNQLKNFFSFLHISSNGALDPWSGGGVLESISESLVAVVIPKGAHHLDLRTPDPSNDPATLSQARQLEMKYISQWLDEYYSRTFFT